jgi:hypothetical protein
MEIIYDNADDAHYVYFDNISVYVIYHPKIDNKQIDKWVVYREQYDAGHLVYNKNKQVKLIVSMWGDEFWETLPLNIQYFFNTIKEATNIASRDYCENIETGIYKNKQDYYVPFAQKIKDEKIHKILDMMKYLDMTSVEMGAKKEWFPRNAVADDANLCLGVCFNTTCPKKIHLTCYYVTWDKTSKSYHDKLESISLFNITEDIKDGIIDHLKEKCIKFAQKKALEKITKEELNNNNLSYCLKEQK